MKKMIYALRFQEILYLVNIGRAATHGYHMNVCCRLILCLVLISLTSLIFQASLISLTSVSSVQFCHGFRHQHQVLSLLDASHIEYKLIGKLVSYLYFLQLSFFYFL